MNAAIKNMLERRSIRQFKSDPVRQEDINAMLQAAIYAPTGKNVQLMRFMLIEGPSPKREAMARHLTSSRPYFEAAPLLIVVLADRESTYHPIKDAQSMGACIQNLMLAAHSLGLGSVWIGQNYDAREQFMPELGLDPKRYDFHAVICVGYPLSAPPGPARKPLEHYILK